MLAPQGPQAAAAARLWWVMFWGGTAILAGVMALVLLAVFRPQRLGVPSSHLLITGGGLAFPIVALTALLLYSFSSGEPTTPTQSPLIIEVTGHQWWWDVRYPGELPVITANEIHLPVGRPVQLRLRSADVIHSLWVPQLAGKQDLIPGHTKTLTLQADASGEYRGQCGEFCGRHHAHMALWVYALPTQAFDDWRQARATPVVTSLAPQAQRGRELFLAARCAHCHSIRGTAAKGNAGPDLTHVASRNFLGAGLVRNRPGALTRWIAAHPRLKTGKRAELFDDLAAKDIEAIAAYLEQLH